MRSYWLLSLLLATMAGNGCATNTGTGALVGTGVGAVGGTILGAAVGRPGVGAALGAGTGALVGGAIGNSEDRREQRDRQAVERWQAAHPPVSIHDVVQMTQNRVPDQTIINQIVTTNSYFSLSAQDVTDLQNYGVSQQVIQTMQSRRHPGPGYVVRPAGRVVVVDPYPPPPPVSFGFGFSSGGRCR
jgi:hypothetical protein